MTIPNPFRKPPPALADLLSPHVASQAEALCARFTSGQPFRHVVIDDFFEPQFCARLVAEFPDFNEKLALNENGELGAKAVHERVRKLGPAFRDLDDLVKQPSFRDLIGQITDIAGLQYDPDYFGGGTHDNRHGQDLDPHIDFNYHPRNGQHRRLNLIVYLNPRWEADWGGLLDLHSDPRQRADQDRLTQIMPVMNRCVIFETTENSWHGFARINLPQPLRHLSRRSFALYYYSRERPPQQTARPHSTVYVDRQLPDRFVPGMTLSEADVQQLETLLMRRDHHNQRLYANIHDLSSQLSSASSYLDYVKRQPTDGQDTAPAGDEEIHRQLQQLAMMRSELAAMRSSPCWRLTRQLRGIAGRLLRRLKN